MICHSILQIRQKTLSTGQYEIELRLRSEGQADFEAQATIDFALNPQEQEDIRWYLEEYLQHADTAPAIQIEQIEIMMQQRGIELYNKVLTFNQNTQAIWFAIRNQLSDLRIEINSGVAEAAAIPWELMRDPQSDSAIAVRVNAFVRVQPNPNISFVRVPKSKDGRIRLLYAVCRPKGKNDVELRAIANRLLQALGDNRARFDFVALRPPTYEQLQRELTDAKNQGQPFHIVHFDGHGCYTDLNPTIRAESRLSSQRMGKRGYLLFEDHSRAENMRLVSGDELGKLLHDNDVPVLILNACQSAMHEATQKPNNVANIHEEIRVIGSLTQAVVDQGIPAVLGMRYSVFVVTAAQYIGELYTGLSHGLSFGHAASEARKYLQRNPDRWIGLQSHSLQDWFVPVIYEAAPLVLLADQALSLTGQSELDPLVLNPALLHYVPNGGFIGRDETLLMLDRAFDPGDIDNHKIVLLHAYAGQGKSSTAVEFARWYAQTGGLGTEPMVLLTSFEYYTTLDKAINQIGLLFAYQLKAINIDWNAIGDFQQRRKLIGELLQKVPVLWIWDNIESITGFPQGSESMWTTNEQQELADFVKLLKHDKQCKAKLILTSRRDEQSWLADIPFRIPMPPMSLSDAALLVLKLGEKRHIKRHQIHCWQPLLHYCEGNPLTLRVVIGQAIKRGFREENQISAFIQALRDGEQDIADEESVGIEPAIERDLHRIQTFKTIQAQNNNEQSSPDNNDQKRNRSLAASLAYGFAHSFSADELPIIALLHLFQGVVDVRVLHRMGNDDEGLPQLKNWQLTNLTELLHRAVDIGLLTQLGETGFAIHPALPWFLHKLFNKYYQEDLDRETVNTAREVWVSAMNNIAIDYLNEVSLSSQLPLEEANFLQAIRLARLYGWWKQVIYVIASLSSLYKHQGRFAEWIKLVNEITPEYCDAKDEPIIGREDGYFDVMSSRAQIAQEQQHDLNKAIYLQRKTVEHFKKQVVGKIVGNSVITNRQAASIIEFAASLKRLGTILLEQNNIECLNIFNQALEYFQWLQNIDTTFVQASVYYDIGYAYWKIIRHRNIDKAEANYLVAFKLFPEADRLNRSFCLQQIGLVYHERFRKAKHKLYGNGFRRFLTKFLKSKERELENYWKSAYQYYCIAINLCPPSAITNIRNMYNQVGNLFLEITKANDAVKYYEKDLQICEQLADHYNAGMSRYNIALCCQQIAYQEPTSEGKYQQFKRALAYAEAALHNFQYYQGHAADWESKVKQLIAVVKQELRRPE